MAGVTQGFEVAGRVNIDFTPGAQPPLWHEVFSCTLCGAMVIGTEGHLALHARWHKQTGTHPRGDDDSPA